MSGNRVYASNYGFGHGNSPDGCIVSVIFVCRIFYIQFRSWKPYSSHGLRVHNSNRILFCLEMKWYNKRAWKEVFALKSIFFKLIALWSLTEVDVRLERLSVCRIWKSGLFHDTYAICILCTLPVFNRTSQSITLWLPIFIFIFFLIWHIRYSH